MAENDTYEIGKTLGYTGAPAKQRQRFLQLIQLASDEELINLAASHRNAVVRVYAYQALRQRKIAISQALIDQFHQDHTQVKIVQGCILKEESVSAIANMAIPITDILQTD